MLTVPTHHHGKLSRNRPFPYRTGRPSDMEESILATALPDLSLATWHPTNAETESWITILYTATKRLKSSDSQHLETATTNECMPRAKRHMTKPCHNISGPQRIHSISFTFEERDLGASWRQLRGFCISHAAGEVWASHHCHRLLQSLHGR